jgi:hypothetical protein
MGSVRMFSAGPLRVETSPLLPQVKCQKNLEKICLYVEIGWKGCHYSDGRRGTD